VTDQAEKDLVLVQLRMPAREYEEIREAARRSLRSANKEIQHRLRQSLATERTERDATAT
jgi:hypothetical protein